MVFGAYMILLVEPIVMPFLAQVLDLLMMILSIIFQNLERRVIK